jgi:hypothetical protein
MPYITLMSPSGQCWTISTRQTETILKAWFDEVLPYAYITGRPGIDDFTIIWPVIMVSPMPAWTNGNDWGDADWCVDSRVLGRNIEFPAMNGEEGLVELLRIKKDLSKEVDFLRRSC